MKNSAPFDSANQEKKGWCISIKQFLNNQKLTQTRKAIVLNDLVDAGSPGVEFFVLVLFSSAIATFGLIADQSVVTIGAQLIDPLMSPLLGLAIASLSGLRRMFRRTLIAAIEGSSAAIALAAIISFIVYRLPYGINAKIPHEVLLRTTASPLDLGIAIVGGAAAAYALAHPRLDAALPGVAIATAIMPPLCTIGYGIAFQNTFIIFGAIFQFLTNLIAITFAAIVTFALLGFRDINGNHKDDLSRSLLISTIMMLIIAIPLGVLAWNTFSAARINSQAKNIVLEYLPTSADPGLIDLSIQSQSGHKEIIITTRLSRTLTENEMVELKDALSEQFGNEITVQLVTLPTWNIE